MEIIPPAQAEPAAPVVVPSPAPAAASTVATEAAPGSILADSQPTGLPMDFESIDSLFKGGGSVEVATEAVNPGTPSTAPASAPAPAPQPGGANPPRLAFVTAPAPPAGPALSEPPPATPAPPAAAPESAPAAPVAAPILPNRIHTAQFEPEAQQAIDLQHTLNAGRKPGETGFVPLQKCFEMLAGPAAAPAIQLPPPGPTAIELAQVKVGEAEASLEALETKRTELSEFGSDLGDLDSQIKAAKTAVIKANVQAELAAERAADNQVAEQARLQAADRTARLTVEAQVAKQYPTVTDHTSALGSRVQALARAMENPSHPDNAVLFTPNSAAFVTDRAAILVAQEMEAMQGIPFAQAWASLRAPGSPQGVPAQPSTAETTERRILPASGSLGTSEPLPALTEAEIMADVGFDPDKLDLLYAGRKSWHIGG